MNSIRRFLIVALLTATVIANFLVAGYGYRSSMAEAEQLFDARLAETAGVLAATPAGFYRSAAGDNAIVFQIWQGDSLEAGSGNAPPEPITAFEAGYSDVKIGGFQWRAFALYLPENNRWTLVAESADIRSTFADKIVLDSVLPIIAGLPFYGLLIWVIVSRGLRPLDDLAKKMRAKRSDDLSPIADMNPSAEISVLVSSINDLLQRLNASFIRERQFAADAAHELRTPISVLKLKLHNLLSRTHTDKSHLLSLQAAVDRMGRSVEQVLMLYRMAPEQFVARFVNVELDELVQQAIADIYPQLETRQQQIELAAEPARVTGDFFALQTLTTNLIENASRYSGAGGRIKVTIQATPAQVILTVEDSGPGISAEHREHVFERFYRGQHDYDSEGSGIGLAIVKNICNIHGAQISLGDSQFESGLAVTVVFQAAA